MKYNNEEGYVLVLGIIILGALIILVFVMTNLIGSDLSFYRNNRDSDRAFYAAESGIAYGFEYFLEELNDLEEGTTISTYKAIDFPSSVNLYDASVKDMNWEIDYRDIKFYSTGKSNNSEKTLLSIYRLDFENNPVLDNAITAGGTLKSKNNHVLVDSGEEGVGDIVSKEGYTEDSTFVKDSEDQDITDIEDNDLEIPTFDSDYLEGLAENKIGISGGSQNFDYDELFSYSNDDYLVDEEDLGNYFTYVNGDLDLGSNRTINGSGVLVVDGTLTLGSNININQDEGYENDYFIIIVLAEEQESIKITSLASKNNIAIQGLIYSSTSTDTGNQFSITGSVISGGDLEIVNSAAAESKDNITYDPNFIDVFESWGLMFEEDIDPSKIEGIGNIISWQEP